MVALLAGIAYFNSLMCKTSIRFYSRHVVNYSGASEKIYRHNSGMKHLERPEWRETSPLTYHRFIQVSNLRQVSH